MIHGHFFGAKRVANLTFHWIWNHFQKKKNLSVPGVELFGNAGLLVHGGPHKNQKREIERKREEPEGGQNGLFTRAFLSLPLSLVGALINMRAERKKERKKKWKERKEREIEKPQQNRTKHNLLCSSSSWLFFILFIFIYLFIINWNFILFFFDVFCCCCCLFLFLPIFSLGFGVRTCVPVGGVFGAWWPFLIFGTCVRLGFEMEGSTLAQCALGPLPFLSRHVSSNFCTIQRLNYTLMCSKIWGYQPKKKKKKV